MPRLARACLIWAKVDRAVGQNQLFCILLKIGLLDFFDILHEIGDNKGHKMKRIMVG